MRDKVAKGEGRLLFCVGWSEGNAEVMFKQMTGSKREVTWLVEERVEEQEVGTTRKPVVWGSVRVGEHDGR